MMVGLSQGFLSALKREISRPWLEETFTLICDFLPIHYARMLLYIASLYSYHDIYLVT